METPVRSLDSHEKYTKIFGAANYESDIVLSKFKQNGGSSIADIKSIHRNARKFLNNNFWGTKYKFDFFRASR